ncbi:DUF6876 family protein [Planktothrix agardhii]|uniref:DUF6876 family protein n=1 Tax=Planktothrix agardhii TaxID=1160 RepID=UPI0020A6EED2|nr:DUF6876 family protein [Planktothrix agardhii]CAD5985615.1 hypothetical protein NO365_04534 [Planktothrix agardhii]
MLTAEQLKTELSQFNGTENYYKHSLGFSYTDGINFLAENAECYWLLDAIGSYQHKLRLNPMLRDFQLWLLVVGDSHEFIKPETESMAVLTCWEDTPVLGVKPAVSQELPFTDFPMSEIKIYLENKVLLLPDER